MSTQITAEIVKNTREKYGLSQRAFAGLLGIGEATIVRYEQGAQPSRANANLILAADDPRFMAGCLDRYGDALTPRQRQQAEKYIYAFVDLLPEENAKEAAMNKMDEIYAFTLRQEILLEKCAGLIADIIRINAREKLAGGPGNHFETLFVALAKLKPTIVDYMDWPSLDRIAGYLECAAEILESAPLKEAS